MRSSAVPSRTSDKTEMRSSAQLIQTDQISEIKALTTLIHRRCDLEGKEILVKYVSSMPIKVIKRFQTMYTSQHLSQKIIRFVFLSTYGDARIWSLQSLDLSRLSLYRVIWLLHPLWIMTYLQLCGRQRAQRKQTSLYGLWLMEVSIRLKSYKERILHMAVCLQFALFVTKQGISQPHLL